MCGEGGSEMKKSGKTTRADTAMCIVLLICVSLLACIIWHHSPIATVIHAVLSTSVLYWATFVFRDEEGARLSGMVLAMIIIMAVPLGIIIKSGIDARRIDVGVVLEVSKGELRWYNVKIELDNGESAWFVHSGLPDFDVGDRVEITWVPNNGNLTYKAFPEIIYYTVLAKEAHP